MASPPPNPREGLEGGSDMAEESSGERKAAPQKTFIAPPASELPSKLEYVAIGAAGPSGSIKQLFRTVKAARRVPTLPSKPKEPEPGTSSSSTGQVAEHRTRARDRAKRHVCSTCEKRFTSPGKLNQHVLSHTGELPFSCDFCDKRFNSKFKLVRHNLVHSKPRAFACTICNKTFNRKDHLTNHIRVHNPAKKTYTCDRPDCKKSYSSSLSYRKHVALHSAEEGNLQCKICDEVFTNQDDIVYHLKVHTGSRTIRNETDKKFTCDSCDRRFFTAKDVRRHLVVHTGRRDFLCPVCPQKFGRKDHLVRHIKNAHTDEQWKSQASTSKAPHQEPTAFEDTFKIDYDIKETDFGIWKPSSPKETKPELVQTRVPSSDIIVEMPQELDIKLEPLEIIKLEQMEEQDDLKMDSTCELLPDFPVVYMVPPAFTETSSELPYMSQSLPDTLETHLLDPANVQSLLMEPVEGPSGLSNQMLELLEERDETFQSEDGRAQQRLPAFTQAFLTTQSTKPPPPPPPPH